jgi:hypothetical protein
MTIGGVALSAFGLRLSRVDGELDMPKFKQVLEEHDYPSNLIVLDEKTVSVCLFGKYGSRSELGSSVAGFMAKVRSEVKQRWTFSSHGFDRVCVVKNAIRTVIYGGIAVEIYVTLTITEE